MNDEFRDADELDTFIEQRRRDDSISPSSTEAAFAADLMEIADSIQPSPAFLAKMAEKLQNSPFPVLNSNGQIQEENNMQIQTPIRASFRQSQYIPWTLAATLAIVFLTATILVGLSIWPSISQSSLAASTTTPVPAANKVLPIAVGGYVSDFSDAVLQQMRDAGLTWIGADLPYYSVINDSVNALQTLAQSLITNAHDRGFRIMLRITGSPSDMIGKSDNYNKEFAQFVGYVAALNADAIQIWDSQNLDLFWREDQIDPAAYIELLHESYTAIKAANPDVMVIMGAPAPTGAQGVFTGKIMNDDLYYQGMAEAYTALGEPAADCIGMSYVEGMVAPDQSSGDSRDNYPTRYFTTMLRRAYEPFQSTGLPLCITEFGYLSGDGLVDETAVPKPLPFPQVITWAEKITAEQQAEWLAQAIKMVSEMSSIQVRMVMIWRINGMPLNSLMSDSWTENAAAEGWFALVTKSEMSSVQVHMVRLSRITGMPLDPLMSGYAIIRPDGACLACKTIASLKQ